MSSSVFQKKELAKKSFWQSLLGGNPSENAATEINNLLAEKAILDITMEDIARIEEKYDVDISKSMGQETLAWFKQYLEFCLRDKFISDTEEKEIRHLGYVLHIPAEALTAIYNEMAGAIYNASTSSALEDVVISDEEVQWIEQLQKNIRLEDEIADELKKTLVFASYTQAINKLLADKKLSPEEDQEFIRIGEALHVTPSFDEKSLANLERFRATWAIENGILPEIDCDIILPKTEKCHFRIEQVDWHEVRTVRQRVGYAGISTRFKLMKGVYLNAGGFKPMSYSRDEVQLIDQGTLYLTSKRIIMTGQKKNYSIRLNTIISVTPYSDGIEIGKQTGRSPMIIMPVGAEVFALALQRLLGAETADSDASDTIEIA
ncbi:MAG: hypothetical protein ACKO6L_00090 [Flavobacteriales bacterium]